MGDAEITALRDALREARNVVVNCGGDVRSELNIRQGEFNSMVDGWDALVDGRVTFTTYTLRDVREMGWIPPGRAREIREFLLRVRKLRGLCYWCGWTEKLDEILGWLGEEA